MAERRMFAKTIIDSDAFIDMPVTARLLYYDLGMRADDDGFVNSPKKIMRMVGASQDDLAILITKKFIIPFDSGIVVIKHWRIHNYIRQDRKHVTKYEEEMSHLAIKDNGAYTLAKDNGEVWDDTCQSSDSQLTDICQSSDSQLTDNCPTEVRLGKVRLGKDSSNKAHPTLDDCIAYAKEKNLNVDAQQFYEYYSEGNWKDSAGKPVKNWKQKMLTWNRHNGNVRSRGNGIRVIEASDYIKQQAIGTLPEGTDATPQTLARAKALQENLRNQYSGKPVSQEQLERIKKLQEEFED